MSTAARVFVTGSTGFIGSKLVWALARRGHTVHALSRRDSIQPPPLQPGDDGADMASRIHVVRGDLSDCESLRKAMAGCSHVFHLAGYAKNWAPSVQTYHDINVQGMINVLEAARQVGAARVVWTSTFMTFGPTKPGEVNDESSPRTIPGNMTDYDASKSAAELEALRFVAEGLPVVIVNPTRVYGPGHMTEGNSLAILIDQYDRGLAPALLNAGRNVGNYVHVDDVVEGHLLAMKSGRPGERYLLGGENVSLRQFFNLIDEISGKKHFTFTVRKPGAMMFALLQQKRAEWFGKHPLITPPWVRVFLSEWAYSSAKAERELGYKSRPLREGLVETYEWLMRLREEQVK